MILAYLRKQRVTGVTPSGQPFELSEAEAHFNQCLDQIIYDIEYAKHVEP
jgi:hypothetical protein